MTSTWRPLVLHRKPNGVPPLLVKFEFGSSDYQVWLTDLSYIWTECLDRRQIQRRALDVETSIDPTEGSAQLRLFLDKIADALGQRPGTSVKLGESCDIKHLSLNTSTSLPHPLPPLEWSILLILAPQLTFASEFVTPLLNQHLSAKLEKTSLLQQIKEKDSVISKLIEKMQGDGVDLGKVFPGVVSSKSGIGHNASWAITRSIKGLRKFDQNQRESQVATENHFSGNLESLLPQIFDERGKTAGEGLQIEDYGDWWKKVGHRDLREEASPPFQEDGLVNDDFQRQSTPTRSSTQTPSHEGLVTDIQPKISRSQGRMNPGESGSTTDDSNDDPQPSHSRPLPLRTGEALLGDSLNDTKGTQLEPMHLDEDGLTANASDIDTSPAKTHLVPKSKQKLGKIGGKRKDSSPETPSIPMSRPKLGRIGGKSKPGKLGGTGSDSGQNEGTASNKEKDSVNPKSELREQTSTSRPTEPERIARMVQQPPEPSSPRETSRERADKKREQLKRQLENKSQAGSKKKRRF